MPSIPHEAALSTLAEMHVAVVGFSLVVGILRPQSQTDEGRLVTLRGVAAIGLIGAVMSMFPVVVHSYGLSLESTWRLSSGVFTFWAVVGIAADFMRLGRGLPPIARQHPVTSVLVATSVLTNLSLLTVNIVNPGPASGSRYVTVSLVALAQAGFMFLWAAFDARGRPAT